jgi:hypothetical protein
MDFIPVLKNLFLKDSKKEVKKLNVNHIKNVTTMSITFIDDTTLIEKASIKPFIIASLQKALKKKDFNFTIDFELNKIEY